MTKAKQVHNQKPKVGIVVPDWMRHAEEIARAMEQQLPPQLAMEERPGRRNPQSKNLPSYSKLTEDA